MFLPPFFGNQVPPCDPFPFVNASLPPPTECAATQHRPPHTRYACSLWFLPHGRVPRGQAPPPPALARNRGHRGSAPARLTVWSCPLFYWPKPFRWVPLTFGASVECLVLGASCLYFHVCAVFSACPARCEFDFLLYVRDMLC